MSETAFLAVSADVLEFVFCLLVCLFVTIFIYKVLNKKL